MIRDPLLTDLGKQQCNQLAQNFPHHATVELLVSSPLRRTLHTTLLSFKTETDKGIKIIALPDLQETSNLPCDTGSPLAELREDFKDTPIDLDLVEPDWESKVGIACRVPNTPDPPN